MEIVLSTDVLQAVVQSLMALSDNVLFGGQKSQPP